jgi:putative ABC transport system permease protein
MRRFVFEVIEGIRIAGQAIWANKMRSTLTTLGVIIGIAAVTLMATVINGLDQEFDKALSQLGTDVLYVDQFPWGQNADREWWRLRNRPAIQPALAQTIQERSRFTETAAPMADTDRRVTYRGQEIEAEIMGSPPQYGRIRNVELRKGRFYTQSEERASRHVCVIGATIAEELFPAITPLGKEIKMGSVPCTVIGVQTKKGDSMFGGPGSPDERVLIPFSTYDKAFGVSRRWGVNVMAKVSSPNLMGRAEEELTGIVRTARGVPPGEPNNFAINDQQQVMDSFASVRIAIYGVGLFLTGLALVVGGIGVMNIMFVSVRERTKEIGIRKAVGAKQRTILFQFLVEAVIVCLIGGVIGLGVSALGAMGVSALGLTASLPMQTIVVAFVICVGVGILFGIAPAWQAATADPIEALRYE